MIGYGAREGNPKYQSFMSENTISIFEGSSDFLLQLRFPKTWKTPFLIRYKLLQVLGLQKNVAARNGWILRIFYKVFIKLRLQESKFNFCDSPTSNIDETGLDLLLVTLEMWSINSKYCFLRGTTVHKKIEALFWKEKNYGDRVEKAEIWLLRRVIEFSDKNYEI